MKGEGIHEMVVVGDILAQGTIIGAEHLLRGGGADNALLHRTASVKQQRRAWRDADIAYRKEHRAGGLTATVDAKALARCVILLGRVSESVTCHHKDGQMRGQRSDHVKGFAVLPKRWIVERTIAWLNRCRRLAKDWENLNRKGLAFLRLAAAAKAMQSSMMFPD